MACLDLLDFDPDQAGASGACPWPGFRMNVGVDGATPYLPAWSATYFATALIWASVSTPLNAGMTPPPFDHLVLRRREGGLSWSRFGPIVPVVPASLSV